MRTAACRQSRRRLRRFEYLGSSFYDRVTRNQYLHSGTTDTGIAKTISTFDRLGQLQYLDEQDNSSGSSSPQVGFKSLSFGYDVAGILRQIDRSSVSSTYAYDKANRLTSINHDVNGDYAIDHQYTYDNASRIASFNTGGDNSAERGYSYDDAGQLTHQIGGFDGASFEYDGNGNRVRRGSYNYTSPIHTIDLANRLTNDGGYSYSYDKEGNVIRRTPLLNISSANPVVNYSYDHRNRLTSVNQHASTANATANGGLGQNPTQTINYTYDAEGRRVKRALDADGGTPSFTSEYFVYNGSDLALRFGNAQELTHRYLYGPEVDQVLADESFKSGTGVQRVTDDVLWQLADHQGTVRDIVDANGVLRKHVNYDAFGQILFEQHYAKNGSPADATDVGAVDQLFYYTGQERDKEAGLYNYNARWYDPTMGRFLSEDPSGFDGGDVNLFRYVGNDPINNTDPTGLQLLKPTQSLTGFGAGTLNSFAQSLGRSSFPLITSPPPVVPQPSSSPRFLSSPIDFQALPQASNAPINKLDEIFMKEDRGQPLSGWEIATRRTLANGPEGVELLRRNPIRAFRIAQLTGGGSGIGYDLSSTSPGPVRTNSGNLHDVADAVGFIPGLPGIVANGANAISYVSQGEYKTAGLSLLAMIPFEKALASGGKLLNMFSKEAKLAKPVEVAIEDAARLGNVSNNVAAEQGRDALGRFVPKNPGELRPGSLAEQATFDAIEQKPGWTVIRDPVYVRDATGQLRVYDGAAVSPKGRVIGLETKSGTATRNKAQREFDTRLNSSNANTATGVGQSSGITIERAIQVRR